MIKQKPFAGTFAVVSIMVGKCVNKYSNIQPDIIANSTDTQVYVITKGYSPIEVATLVCFIVGVIQVKFKIKLFSTLTDYLL